MFLAIYSVFLTRSNEMARFIKKGEFHGEIWKKESEPFDWDTFFGCLICIGVILAMVVSK